MWRVRNAVLAVGAAATRVEPRLPTALRRSLIRRFLLVMAGFGLLATGVALTVPSAATAVGVVAVVALLAGTVGFCELYYLLVGTEHRLDDLAAGEKRPQPDSCIRVDEAGALLNTVEGTVDSYETRLERATAERDRAVSAAGTFDQQVGSWVETTRETARDVADGDVRRRFETDAPAPLDGLSTELDGMLDDLEGTLFNVRSFADEVDRAAIEAVERGDAVSGRTADVAERTEAVAERLERQQRHLERAAATADELEDRLDDAESTLDGAASHAEAALDAVDAVDVAAEQAGDELDALSAATDRAYEETERLRTLAGESSASSDGTANRTDDRGELFEAVLARAERLEEALTEVDAGVSRARASVADAVGSAEAVRDHGETTAEAVRTARSGVSRGTTPASHVAGLADRVAERNAGSLERADALATETNELRDDVDALLESLGTVRTQAGFLQVQTEDVETRDVESVRRPLTTTDC